MYLEVSIEIVAPGERFAASRVVAPVLRFVPSRYRLRLRRGIVWDRGLEGVEKGREVVATVVREGRRGGGGGGREEGRKRGRQEEGGGDGHSGEGEKREREKRKRQKKKRGREGREVVATVVVGRRGLHLSLGSFWF